MCAPYVEARPEGGARAEKEIGEKAQKIIRYQIVSTYFLHGALFSSNHYFCQKILSKGRGWSFI
jgi:hypothetical protein